MGRDSLNIKEFKYGVISSVDVEDIPSESASDSLNIDGDVAEGTLQGIPTDVVFEAPTGSNIAYIKQGEFIEHDGIYDLIYHDKQNNTISVITDFYGTTDKKKLNIISSLSSDNVTLTLHNQQVHVGIDGAQGYWVGRMDHGQFDYGISWAIASIANDAGTIVVTTTPTHALKNGDIIKISNATGNDATTINGIWVVSAVNHAHKTFKLVGSTCAGTEVSLYSTPNVELYITYEVGHCICYSNAIADGYFDITGVTLHAATGYFQAGIWYSWAFSFIYDGIQESPIIRPIESGSYSPESDYISLEIKAYKATPVDTSNETGLSSFNKRITAVNLYRADSIDATASKLGLYRLVASIDINDDNWVPATLDQTLTIRDYGTSYSLDAGTTIVPGNPVTYEENSGMPENLTDPSLYYALSTAGGGYHFVTKCTQATLAGSELRRIFKSKYFRYDMFDYYADFLEMPEPIIAMKYYEGFLYASSLNKIYRINIEGFFIQDVFEDAGCHDQFSITTNEQGMFFANYNNAWMYQGGNFIRIGDAVRQSVTNGKSWTSFVGTGDLSVVSDAKKGYILFINERSDSGNKIFAWGYHPARNRWDCFSFAGYASAGYGCFKGKDGEIYISNAVGTYKLMRHATNRQLWEWYSQDFVFGEPRQNKSITSIKIDATGTVAINYGFEGAAVNVSYTNEALINEYKKSIRVKLNASAATSSNSVDSMEVIFRPMIGFR